MKQLIIDAYNAIYKISRLEACLNTSNEHAREELIQFVLKWSRKCNYQGKIFIVFDGSDGFVQKNRTIGLATIMFSKSEEEADGRILSMVRNSKDRAVISVVTDDEKHIGSVCKSLGVTVLHPNFLLDTPRKNKTKNDKELSYTIKKEINEDLKKAWDIK